MDFDEILRDDARRARSDALRAEFRAALRDDPLLMVEIVEYVMTFGRGEKPILPRSAREYAKTQAGTPLPMRGRCVQRRS